MHRCMQIHIEYTCVHRNTNIHGHTCMHRDIHTRYLCVHWPHNTQKQSHALAHTCTYTALHVTGGGLRERAAVLMSCGLHTDQEAPLGIDMPCAGSPAITLSTACTPCSNLAAFRKHGNISGWWRVFLGPRSVPARDQHTCAQATWRESAVSSQVPAAGNLFLSNQMGFSPGREGRDPLP